MADETVKQLDNNSTKGFASHPELINRNGRPKKGTAITDLLRSKLKPEAVTDKLISLIEEGDLKAIEYAIDRLEGKPQQSIGVEPIEFIKSPMAETIQQLRESTVVQSDTTDISNADTKPKAD